MSAPAASQNRWTDAQLRAIRATGSAVLVSAAAGSGKTSVLAERCAYLIADAKPRCNITNLLVVTFTEAAAAEMKSRIEQTLRRRLENAPDDAHLRKQCALIDHAHISTLHGFCARLLRQHFHRLGLDPAFRILDADEAYLLRLETLRDLFMEQYDAENADAFRALLDSFAEGDDEPLMHTLLQTYELLRSLVNPAAWIQHSKQQIDDAIANPLESSDLGKQYLDLIRSRIDDLGRDARITLESLHRLDFPKYVDYVESLLATLRDWRKTLTTRGLDPLASLVNEFILPRLPSIPAATPGKDVAQQLVNSVQKRMKEGPLIESLRFTSDEWKTGLQSTRPHLDTFLHLLEEFGRRYRSAKNDIKSLDFADLERYALLLLEDSPNTMRPSPVARSLHKQFHHVLVDEYQDINELQDAILTLASRQCVAADDRPSNLFSVGDVKQSIYRFRLAEPTLFLNRSDLFRDDPSAGQLINLQSNFRSRPPLLDALNLIFQRLMTKDPAEIEYDQSHHLRPAATFPQSDLPTFPGAPIELHLLPDDLADEDAAAPRGQSDLLELERSEREALLVASRIREMLGHSGSQPDAPRMNVTDRTGALRPIEYRDIVILLRATRYHADQYADVLRRCGIPVFNAAGGGYFDAVEIRDLLSLLRLLDNQRQDIPLAAILRSPLSGISKPDDALAAIRLAYPDSDASPIPFHHAVLLYATEKDDALSSSLRSLFSQLDRWRKLARSRPIDNLLQTIFDETGYPTFCAGLHNGRQRLANLQHLLDRARQFGSFSRQNLYRFIRFLESLREETDLAQAADASESDNVVRILSIHKSKGLEFPVVFVPELGKKINFQGCSGRILADRRAGLALEAVDHRKRIRYDSLATHIVSHRLRRQTIAEELRILYVAMTRAREHLILVGTCRPSSSDLWSRRWDLHQGPLPPDVIASAKCTLDWLGPVAAALAPSHPAPIQVYDHPAEAIQGLASSLSTIARQTVNSALVSLAPQNPAPAPDSAAERILSRLAFTYPYSATARLSASHDLQFATPDDFLPREFLHHLDFSRVSAIADLQAQLAELLSRKLLAQSAATDLDLSTIDWFLSTHPGRLLIQHHPHFLRRQSFHAPIDPASAADSPMLRATLDFLIPHGSALTLIQFTPMPTESLLANLSQCLRTLSRATRKPIESAYAISLSNRHQTTLPPITL